jgi:hypothetical protein
MSDNKSKNVKIENNSEDKTGETKKTTISLFYRILIPIIVIIYLILVNSYFDNYKKDFSWGMVDKIKTKKSLFDGKQQWDFLNHEIFIKLNPFTYMATQIEYIEESLLLNSNVESVSLFLKKTGIYLLKPIFILLPIIFNTYTYQFSSVVKNEPKYLGKSWTVMLLIFLFTFIIPLYSSAVSFYLIGFILLFYLFLPIINVVNTLPAFIDAKYVFIILGYYILSTIVTNQIKLDHPDLWNNGLDKKFSIANTLLAISILILFFIF